MSVRQSFSKERRLDSPILVVDDDEANLIALRAVLADLGHTVVTVRSGEEALRRLLREDFAVILLDVRMPGMDGYETAELIRGRERSRDVPIIFLSGVDKDEAHLFRGYAAGAVDYVFKPIEPVILRSKVAVLTQLYENAQEIRRQAEHEKRLMAENLEVRAREASVARELEQSLVQQSLVLEALPIALFVAPAEGGYRMRRFVGGNLERLCGLGDADGGDVDWLDHIHPDDAPLVEQAIENLAEKTSYQLEYRVRCGDGSIRWLFERADRKTSGGAEHLFGIVTDVSARKRLEEQLTHAQKIEAIGRMSGGIAHDFNNMLGVIVGSIERIEATEKLTEKGQQRMSLAMQAVQSCADLTKRLLGFARRQALEPRELDVAAELDRLQGLLDRMLGETVKTLTECAENIPHVFVDPSQFESAIVNLLVNARDAMPEGGTLTISAAPAVRDDADDALGDLPPGEFVRLSVSDTGRGMDEATLSRALEPFFTTKGPDRGTGLGLSTIYGFIRQSGGDVRIESEPGHGTTVHLYLPAVRVPTHRVARVQKKAAKNDLKGVRVLAVEDNDKMREVAAAMLDAIGCEIITACDAADALVVAETQSFDVLFSDCVMPGELDGPGLARILKEKDPSLAVLLTSGYRESSTSRSPDCAGFLRKPYTGEQLAAAIRDAMGRADRKTNGAAKPASPRGKAK